MASYPRPSSSDTRAAKNLKTWTGCETLHVGPARTNSNCVARKSTTGLVAEAMARRDVPTLMRKSLLVGGYRPAPRTRSSWHQAPPRFCSPPLLHAPQSPCADWGGGAVAEGIRLAD
jgi:hypothetical protein